MSERPDGSLDASQSPPVAPSPEGAEVGRVGAAQGQELQVDAGRGSVTLNLAQATKDLITREGRESLSAAVRGLIRDRVSLFEMPRPARLVLERDMEQHGITDQRDYVIWLLLERHRHLLGQGRSR